MSSYTSNPENARVKEALERLNKVATPVVTDILGIAQRGVAEALSALQRAQESAPAIANAAVDVGSAHADLLTSTLKRNNSPDWPAGRTGETNS
jgi:hypothetical protein